jgi:hypothetical protein
MQRNFGGHPLLYAWFAVWLIRQDGRTTADWWRTSTATWRIRQRTKVSRRRSLEETKVSPDEGMKSLGIFISFTRLYERCVNNPGYDPRENLGHLRRELRDVFMNTPQESLYKYADLSPMFAAFNEAADISGPAN